VGGVSASLTVETQIRLPRDGNQFAIFRGQFSAVTVFESLDISILGRDILGLFSVIVDRPGDVIALIRPPQGYAIGDL